MVAVDLCNSVARVVSSQYVHRLGQGRAISSFDDISSVQDAYQTKPHVPLLDNMWCMVYQSASWVIPIWKQNLICSRTKPAGFMNGV